MMDSSLQYEFFGNSIEDFLWFFGIVLVGYLFKKFFAKVLSALLYRLFKKYSTEISAEKFIELLIKPVGLFVFLIIIYFAFIHLEYPESWVDPEKGLGIRMVIERSYQTMIFISITWICLRLVDFLGLILLKKAERTESKQDDQIIPFVIDIAKVLVVIFSSFMLLGSVFNLNIASLIAGLGIGGLAIALAAKESLENLLGSFTIFFDKPFVVGDFVKAGNIEGTIEKVGFRSTRIRTLEKSFLTIPNKKMVDAELDNLTLRTLKRVKFNIHVDYQTPSSKLKMVIEEIQKILNAHPLIQKEDCRARLYAFNPASIEILVLYFITSMDYDTYLSVREEINFRIMEILDKEGVKFSRILQLSNLK